MAEICELWDTLVLNSGVAKDTHVGVRPSQMLAVPFRQRSLQKSRYSNRTFKYSITAVSEYNHLLCDIIIDTTGIIGKNFGKEW